MGRDFWSESDQRWDEKSKRVLRLAKLYVERGVGSQFLNPPVYREISFKDFKFRTYEGGSFYILDRHNTKVLMSQHPHRGRTIADGPRIFNELLPQLETEFLLDTLGEVRS
jgi:hypothetical protein